MKMYILNNFSDNICLLANIINLRSELSEKTIMILNQGYEQLNRHEAALEIVLMNTSN
jgi:hypothetical protein